MVQVSVTAYTPRFAFDHHHIPLHGRSWTGVRCELPRQPIALYLTDRTGEQEAEAAQRHRSLPGLLSRPAVARSTASSTSAQAAATLWLLHYRRRLSQENFASNEEAASRNVHHW